jgi:carnitine-CoA ligase
MRDNPSPPALYALEERTIGRILADKARRIPQHTFLIWQDQRYSYAQLESLTNRYANGFSALGIQHGDHVAVMLPNGPEFFWVVWGLAKLGAVAVPLNTAAKGDMLRYFIDQSDSMCMVIDQQWLDRLAPLVKELSKVKRYLVARGDACNDARSEVQSDTRNGAPGATIPGSPESVFAAQKTISESAAIRDLVEIVSLDGTAPPLDRVKSSDPHLIVYTSGTTGPSKGVMCPHSQALFVGMQIASEYGYQTDDVLYTCLPLFHVNALWYSSCAALWAECSIALSARFSASVFWDEICAMGATQFNALGAMANIIVQIPPGDYERKHRLRQCMLVPMQKSLYDEVRQRYGVKITAVFAMSENYAVTNFAPDDRSDKVGSAGSPRGASLIKIINDEGLELAAGQVGEILVKPTQPGSMMLGYYKMPEATTLAFREGWFCTGDRGYLDSDSYLYFVDRKKEAIRRRGENISAYEVEMILSKHPAILEVAAIAVPSEMSEDEVMVYVVLQPGHTLSEREVVAFGVDHMNYFMVPRFVAFVDQLPKTATQKIEKYKLQQDAKARRANLWDREREGIVVRR